MHASFTFLLVTAAVSTTASGQVVSEWRTARGLPVAVVEIAGGDVEHLAALLPAEAAAPGLVAGFPTAVRPGRQTQLWSVAVPALAAQRVLTEAISSLAVSGSSALVALGPAPAREVQAMASALEAIPVRAPIHVPCVLAEGGVAERLGTPEAVELEIALPQSDDPRADLSPALVSWVQTRLAPGFPDVRVTAELLDGCARMVIRAPARDEHPRLVLRRLRQVVGQLPTQPASGDELARAVSACEQRAGQAVVDGASVARELAERLALGGSAVRAFAVPSIDSTTLAELGRQVLGGHPGSATLFERERRPQAEPVRTLDNGVEVSTRWIPGEMSVIALALGGVAPRWGHEMLAVAATTAARQGWPASVSDVSGVPTLAIAVPGASITDAIERISESLSSARPAPRDDLEAEVSRALGLVDSLTAETLSVALVLPPEVEVGGEAAEKFFGGFPSGRVTTGVTPARPGLQWTVGQGTPQILGLVELPPSPAGQVARQLVRDRLSREEGVRAMALVPPGRSLLAVGCEGGENVPALDARLAALWKGAQRPASGAEVTAAARATVAVLYGDTAQAAARTAAAVFLPTVPSQEELLSIEAGEVNRVIAALPAWDKLTRFAHGSPPPAPTPTGGKLGVRKSHSPPRHEP